MTTYYVLSQAKFGATVITFYYIWSALRPEIAGASVALVIKTVGRLEGSSIPMRCEYPFQLGRIYYLFIYPVHHIHHACDIIPQK